MIKEGQKTPSFTLKDEQGKERSLTDYQGKNIILYFYPKDNTPGCTIEAQDFTRLRKEYEKNNTVILGISKDTCESHQTFINKQQLNITLLSDPTTSVQQQFGVWKEKSFMGKKFMGTIRSTFLINKQGIIIHHWDNVKAKGHAEEVLRYLKQLS